METHRLFNQAKELAKEEKTISLALLKDRFGIGINSDSYLMDQLERAGIVSAFEGNPNRKVLTK